MGTQQILMIILSVIIVGTAIAVGIQMFDTQHENNVRQSLAAELMQQMSQVLSWYRTPNDLGGGGNGRRHPQASNPTQPRYYYGGEIASYVYGKNNTTTGTGNIGIGTGRNLHGDYRITVDEGGGGLGNQFITIYAISAANPDIQTRIRFRIAGNGSDAVVEQGPPFTN